MGSRFVSWVALAGAILALAALAAPGCSRQADRPADLLLLYTSNVHGYIEPCGCVAGQIGGIDRIAGYIEDARAANPNSIFVDAGDLVAEEITHELPVTRQLPIKARALLRVWGALGCDALGLGENDLALGAELMKTMAAEHGVPILCGNLVDAAGELVFPASRVIERGGRRIGIFSMLSGQLEEPKAQQRGRVDVAKIAERQGLSLLPWQGELERVARELDASCDLVVFVSHLGFDRNKRIAEGTRQIDVILGGHFGESERETNVVNGTPVLVAFVRGARVGHLEWWWPEPAKYFQSEGHGDLVDASAWTSARVGLDVAAFELADLAGREAGLGSEEWDKQQRHHARERTRQELGLAALGPAPQQNRFAHVLVPMHSGLRRSELALRDVDRYHTDLGEFWTARERAPLERASYPGPDSCAACHPRQHDFWMATRHSRALSALEATGQQYDAECIGCHTVGWLLPDGFNRPDQHAGFENVQCAACHGPGGAHLRGGVSFLQRNQLRSGAIGCARCHNKEHDPHFEKESLERLPLVACPPLEPPGAGSPALIASYARAAELLSERPSPPWEEIALARWKAGDAARSLAAAQAWHASDPGSPAAQLLLGTRLVDVGRAADALELLEQVLAGDANNGDAWLALSRATRDSDPARALRAAQEAFSLSKALAPLRAWAEALLSQGRSAEAREVLEGAVRAGAQRPEALADLLERCR